MEVIQRVVEIQALKETVLLGVDQAVEENHLLLVRLEELALQVKEIMEALLILVTILMGVVGEVVLVL